MMKNTSIYDNLLDDYFKLMNKSRDEFLKVEEKHIKKDNYVCKILSNDGYFWPIYVQLGLAIFGICGNTLNIIIFGRRIRSDKVGELRLCACLGFLFLAFADLCYNLLNVPFSILYWRNTNASTDYFKMSSEFRVYGLTCLNFFLVLSTWLTVKMAIERNLMIIWPLHFKRHLTKKKSIITFFILFIACILITLPEFLRVQTVPCSFGSKILYQPRQRFQNTKYFKAFEIYHQWVWPFFVIFTPYLLLMFCNINLMICLWKAHNKRSNYLQHSTTKDGVKIARILVVLIIMQFFFVFPAELIKFEIIEKSIMKGHEIHTKSMLHNQIIIKNLNLPQKLYEITNLLQSINFSFNFILYCLAERAFRKDLLTMFRGVKKRMSLISFSRQTISTSYHIPDARDLRYEEDIKR